MLDTVRAPQPLPAIPNFVIVRALPIQPTQSPTGRDKPAELTYLDLDRRGPQILEI